MSELQNQENRPVSLLDQVVEQAAFLGSFNPWELMPNGEHAEAEALFSALAEKCVEVDHPDGFQWALTPDARSNTFERLAQHNRLRDVAENVSGSPLLDGLGNMLVNLVIAPAPSPADMAPVELDMLRVARGLLGNAVASVSQNLINTELERRSIDQAISQLRSKELIGREGQLASILNWIHGSFGKFSMMSISGIGGIGKSALVAELVARLRGPDWSGDPVVWMDFDHPVRDRLDPTSVMDEMLRQLALHPAFNDSVQGHRSHLNTFYMEGADQRSADAARIANTSRESIWNEVLADSNIKGLRMLVICDTFEELLYRGIDERTQLLQFLKGLSDAEAVHSVHVICSGRELPPSKEWHFDDSLSLEGLVPSEAVELFWRTAGLSPTESLPVAALIDKYGGNPLVIKLLARQAVSNRTVFDSLLAEEIPSKADSEFIQGFLYTRILNRIRTARPEVVKLAYPGLALRRVSPLLIRNVLAEPCGLGALNEQECKLLFDELARQFWLVQATTDPQVVLHRKDLRRLMLMSIDREHVNAIEAIHLKAIDFYDKGLDPVMSAQEQAIEADYHRLLIGTLPDLDSQYAYHLLQSVGLDLPCIPVVTRASLKLHGGRELSDVEKNALRASDIPLHHALVRERQSALGDELESYGPNFGNTDLHGLGASIGSISDQSFAGPSGKPEAASPLPHEGIDTQKPDRFTDGSPVASREMDPAGIHQAFSFCKFDWLSRHAFKIADLTLQYGSTLGLSREGRTLTESPLWQVSIASLVTGQSVDLAEHLKSGLASHENGEFERWNRYGSESISFTHAVAAVIRLLSPATYLSLPMDRLSKDFGQHITTHEKLRAWQMLHEIQRSRLTEVRFNLLTYMDDVFLHGLDPGLLQGFEFEDWTMRLKEESIRSHHGLRIASLQRLASAGKSLRVRPNPGIDREWNRILAGPATELYPILRAVLNECPTKMFKDLCNAMEDRFEDLWPRELRWDAFSSALEKEREQWIATFIEFADRFGRLAFLVEYIAVYVREVPDDVWRVFRVFMHRIEMSIDARFRLPSNS